MSCEVLRIRDPKGTKYVMLNSVAKLKVYAVLALNVLVIVNAASIDAYFKFHKQYKRQSSIRKRLSAVYGGTPLLDRGGILERKPLPSFTSSAMASVFVRSVSTQ